MPISRVRSSTAVYMVFAMPRQASSSATTDRPSRATRSRPNSSSKPLSWSPVLSAWKPSASRLSRTPSTDRPESASTVIELNSPCFQPFSAAVAAHWSRTTW